MIPPHQQKPLKGEPALWHLVSEHFDSMRRMRVVTHAMEVHGTVVLHITTSIEDDMGKTLFFSSTTTHLPEVGLRHLWNLSVEDLYSKKDRDKA